MASKRRSSRLRKVPVKYFKEDSSEGEEETLDGKYKDAKLKLKQMINEGSDAESDFEAELIKSVVEYNSDKDDVLQENKTKNIEILREINNTVDNNLCLSESDSSDDERMEPGVKIGVKRKEISITEEKATTYNAVFLDDYKEEEEEESSRKLIELVGNLERMKDAWNEDSCEEKENIKNDLNILPSKKSIRKSARNSSAITTSKDSNLDNIFKLLTAGEGVSSTGELSDALDDDDDTNPCEPIIPKEGVEITVQLPKHLKKKKRKGFDVAAFLKRKLSRARRELALVQHKSHLTCLLGHMFYLHKNLSTRLLHGLALSIVPSSHFHTPSNLTLTNLGSLTSWVRENIPVDRYKMDTTTNSNITTRLITALESWVVVSDMDLVLVFVLICRALGYNTRLVLNCHTLPIKPSEHIEPTIDTNTIDGKSAAAESDPKNEPGKCKKRNPEQSPKGSMSKVLVDKKKTRNKIKTGIVKKSGRRVSVRLSTEGYEIQDIEEASSSVEKTEPKSVKKICVKHQKRGKIPISQSQSRSNTSTTRD